MSRGTSSGAVCGALRGSILRPSGHIATVPGAGRLWGSLLQGHPAQGRPIISAVCCWGRIDHRNNNDDIFEHRSSCVSSGIGSSLAELDLNLHARCSDPTAASRQVTRQVTPGAQNSTGTRPHDHFHDTHRKNITPGPQIITPGPQIPSTRSPFHILDAALPRRL